MLGKIFPAHGSAYMEDSGGVAEAVRDEGVERASGGDHIARGYWVLG